jgi:hypothetical protein
MLQCAHELATAAPGPPRRDNPVPGKAGLPVNDTAFLAISVAFFVVSAAFARFCGKVR